MLKVFRLVTKSAFVSSPSVARIAQSQSFFCLLLSHIQLTLLFDRIASVCQVKTFLHKMAEFIVSEVVNMRIELMFSITQFFISHETLQHRPAAVLNSIFFYYLQQKKCAVCTSNHFLSQQSVGTRYMYFHFESFINFYDRAHKQNAKRQNTSTLSKRICRARARAPHQKIQNH